MGNRRTIIFAEIIFLAIFSACIKKEKGFLQMENAQNFLYAHMMEDGAVRTNYQYENYIQDYATGGDILSESQGLVMEYAVNTHNRELFDKSLRFIKNTLYTDDIISYRYSPNGGIFNVNASLDDLRIIRALLNASDTFLEPDYQVLAMEYAEQLYKTNVDNDILFDFYDTHYNQRGDALTLCYLDLKTMYLLSENNPLWKNIYLKCLSIVQDSYISSEFPLYARSYSDNSYNSDEIETVQSILTAIHLAEIGKCPSETVKFIKNLVINDRIVGKYTGSGKEASTVESTAIYALASLLGAEVGDSELQEKALERMLTFQVTDKNHVLYGAFADANTMKAYSFDNLCALIAFSKKYV